MNEQSSNNHRIHYRSGISIFPEQVMAIETSLRILQAAIPARMTVLVDTSGQMITKVGEAHGVDADALGSLVAGDLAASHEIARMIGEFQDFQMILREGTHSHIIIAEAGQYFVLFVLFSKEVPLGWARKMIQKTAADLSRISIETDEEAGKHDAFTSPLVEGEMTDLINDALDDLWKG